MEIDEDVCLNCFINDEIENDSLDKFFEYEYVLNDVSNEELNKINVNLDLND